MARQVKSKQRVTEYGEVFTADREVQAMCDLVKQETERIDSRFLEPACGDGNFLSVILQRKLSIVTKKYKHSAYDWERNSLLALGSMYGVDILLDNVFACQERLFEIWNKEYKNVCKKECNDETREAARFILSLNIVCGNALTLLCCDAEGKELNVPIIFSEWTLPFNDARMQRKDYTFAELLKAADTNKKIEETGQMNLFANENGEVEPTSSSSTLHTTDTSKKTIPVEEKHISSKLTKGGEDLFNMKFDVIIGNPPYQLSDGGNGASAKPIYNLFVEQAKKLKPRFLTMIIPSRWFAGGKGLDDFRESMLTDKRVVKIVDYVNAKDCFAGISLSGGVCYFLWDRDNPRKCEFTNIHNGKESTDIRNLSEFPVFVRYNEAISVIRKVLAKKENMVSEVVGSRNPFGLSSSARGVKEKREITLYSSAGTGYVTEHEVTQGKQLIKKYKVMISKVTSEHAGEPDKSGMFAVLSTVRVLKPQEVCTDSYLIAYQSNEAAIAENFAKYMCTKFFRFLLLQAVSSINLSKDKFQFVPMQDFTKEWTDEMLYAKYGLSQDEIEFIESMMKEKELDGMTGQKKYKNIPD